MERRQEGDTLEHQRAGGNSPIHIGEIGDLGVSFVRFLSWSVDLPMRASWSFANFAFARRWVGVWTWRAAVSTRRKGIGE